LLKNRLGPQNSTRNHTGDKSESAPERAIKHKK
jgi:hypothetical protein